MPDIITIDDNNYRNFIDPIVDGERKSCTLRGMFAPELSAGYRGTFDDLAGVELIPQSEWPDRIRQMEKDKTRLPDFANDMGLRIRNQNGTNYCWAYGTCRSMEYALLSAGTRVDLSASSVACWIKNFANQGGWGSECIDGLARYGVCTLDEWPEASRSRSHDTSGNREAAKRRRILEWYKLSSNKQRAWQETVSAILQGYAVGCGFNWWSHLICGTWLQGNYSDPDLGIDNSWGTNWSDGGRGLLRGSRKLPDGAVIVTSVTAI